ncbi:MAG: hypothetical protein ACJ77K_06425 [Bacteroidia bacterium]
MQKFEFEISVFAPSKEDAVRKMKALIALGKHLNLSELQALENTVSSPTALAIAKSKLGLQYKE